MPSTIPTWTTPIADVQQRLARFQRVLEGARRRDGGVDLKHAKALAGRDVRLADMLSTVRASWSSTELTAEQARRAFLELRVAQQSAKGLDANGDGCLGFRELPFYASSDDPANRLLLHAAKPVETADGQRAKPRVALSLEARREAEQIILETARFHAASPLGAEALAWSMREAVTAGFDIRSGVPFDAVNYTESDWRAKLPLVGKKFRGQGHLSDRELTARFGDLSAYVQKTRAAVNARLMMDYASEFLAGRDLP